jgi:putative endonuclease
MFVYILISEVDGSFYVGMTSNPEERLKSHNAKKVKSTKGKVPWHFVYLEEVSTISEARKREKYLKSAAGRRFRREKLGD